MSKEFTNELEEPSIKELIKPFVRSWFWFVISIIIAILFSLIYLRYTIPIYETQASVLLKDRTDNGLSADLDPFKNLGIFKKFSTGKLENDLAILNSRRIISKVIEGLGFNVKYEIEGRVIKNELYGSSPIMVLFTPQEIEESFPSKLGVAILSETKYELSIEEKIIGEFTFGEKVSTPGMELLILPDEKNAESFDRYIEKIIIVTYTKTIDLALAYQEELEIFNDIDNSNVVSIKLKTPVKKKTEDFINELIHQYNLDAAEDQNMISRKTASFIDSRIKIIIKDLDSVEIDKREFKIENRLTDIEAESKIVLAGATEFSNKQVELYTKIEVLQSVLTFLKKDNSIQLLPANIGIEDGDLASAIDYYNQLVIERNRLLSNSTIENPIVANIDSQLYDYRSSIVESLNNSLTAIKVALKDVNRQESKFKSRLSKVPAQEKYFREIVRQQEIKEELYIFLLKQREQASIKLATTTSKAKVIDEAFTSKTAISPKKQIILLGSILLGFIIPFIIIYLKNLLNTKIENRKDVERALRNFSIVGEIPKIKTTDNQIIRLNDRSILAESFRILRTNLQYFFINKINGDQSKIIFVTSTIKGEGKTLTAFNLALTLSYSGNKIALVGADIRNPQVQRYLPEKYKKHLGLTEFIIDDSIEINNVVVPSEYDNLDIVLSGEIPPNPAELLLQDRVEVFFNELRKTYDYVIVDTAPSMLVTDTLLLSKYADVVLYVMRANYTEKKLLEFTKDVVEEGKLKNVALILNGVTMNNFGYGNKYGYAYSNEKPGLKERLFGF